jgi:hypothetical protein
MATWRRTSILRLMPALMAAMRGPLAAPQMHGQPTLAGQISKESGCSYDDVAKFCDEADLQFIAQAMKQGGA